MNRTNMAIQLDQSKISDDVRRDLASDVRELSILTPYKTYVALAVDWLVIGLSIAASITFQSTWVYLVSVLLIAARQHSLLIIMHEAAHRRISNRLFINDFVGDFFAALPIFMGVGGYREHHTQHHLHLNTNKDPDWTRKIVHEEWQFPKTKKNFSLMLLKYLFLGGSLREWVSLMLIFSGFSKHKGNISWLYSRELMVRLLYYGSAIALISYFSHWSYIFLYWLGPYVFVMLLFQRIRSIAEHFGTSREHEFSETRNVLCSDFEAFFMGPHNVNYHLDHHIFPSVPFYNLPKLHLRLLAHEGYRQHAHLNKSYVLPGEGSLLRDLLNENKRGI